MGIHKYCFKIKKAVLVVKKKLRHFFVCFFNLKQGQILLISVFRFSLKMSAVIPKRTYPYHKIKSIIT